MAKPITPFAITAPGFLGVNTQDSPVEMPHGFSLIASNCVIDKSGRVASRKGWAKAHTANTELSTGNVTCIGEVIENGGTATTVCAGNGYLFKLSGTTLTTLTYGGGGVAPTISANNWQFCQLNGIGIFWQRVYDPLIYDPAVSTTTFRRLSEKVGYAGTVPLANTAISAYGRIWCADTTADKNTVTFSDIITPQVWTGGSSGTLNLLSVWPKGGDKIIALAEHNNFLVIFGKTQTLIYSGAGTPSSMALADHLNVGCIARDSVQNTGDDILFLSNDGVRSLKRTIQEKSAPLVVISRNVRDEMISHVSIETLENIKSGYSPAEAIYVITLPVALESYCFDTRHPLEDGSFRTTTWSTYPKCFFSTADNKFYLGEAGYIGLYSTYLDDATEYRMKYYSTWIDFGNPLQTSILKKAFITLIGTTSQDAVVKWGFDFESTYNSETVTIVNLFTPSEYGIAEYGIAEYGYITTVQTLNVHPGGSGTVVQFGIETQISNSPVSIQKIAIFTKDGKLGG